ncbi:MAG: PfkB family carbohydrate kinase [Anaerolineae bacterium]
MTHRRPAPEYLVIGHVTKDLLPDGGTRAGGTATYSALAARKLGADVGVLTSAGPDMALFVGEPDIRVCCKPAAETTTFENVYESGARRQYIRGVAGKLDASDLPESWRAAPIVQLGPVAQEVDASLAQAFTQPLIGVTPQGWLRRWDGDGLVSAIDWVEAQAILDAAHVVVLSMEDLGGDRRRFAAYRRMARMIVLTAGPKGAYVFQGEREDHIPAYAVTEVDPTGAGDVFATAFLIRLRETDDPVEAARFANCTASFVVEGLGTSTLPARDQVEWRLRHGRLRD